MLPLIVGELLAQGLGILGNAVLSKGKDVIEQKLGVNLETELATPEGKMKLKQLEVDHEEFLINSALENRKLDLQDVQGAREMNIRINESAEAAWLPKNIASILAIIVVLGGGSMLAWSPNPDVRTAAVGLVTLVLGFYFGSSSSGKTKDTTIANLSRGA